MTRESRFCMAQWSALPVKDLYFFCIADEAEKRARQPPEATLRTDNRDEELCIRH